MRHLAWSAALVAMTGCYLAPDKYDEAVSETPDPSTDPDGGMSAVPGTDAAMTGNSSCTTSDSCGADAPLCVGRVCVSCTAHEHCSRFAATPACGPQGTCVPCTADELRACPPTAPACDPTANQCVQCLDDKHCADPQKSACNTTSHLCEACATSDDCAHLKDKGKGVCLEGTCVECARNNLGACTQSVLGEAAVQYVCNPIAHICDRGRPARSKQACEACISDLECSAGNVCVDVPAGAGQRVCQPARTMNACARPYASATQPLLTADGERTSVCTFGVDTTCEAHRHYRNQRCGTATMPGGMQDIEGSGNNARCGALGRDDGVCIWNNALRQHLCTVPCNNNAVDCPVGIATCQTGTNLCSL